MGWFSGSWAEVSSLDGDAAAYRAARADHDQSKCGGTWRSHSDPQERLDCIKTSDENRSSWWRR